MVALYNHSDEQRIINVGDRIAQMVFQQYGKVSNFIEVEELSKTDRGEGKFGSTGK